MKGLVVYVLSMLVLIFPHLLWGQVLVFITLVSSSSYERPPGNLSGLANAVSYNVKAPIRLRHLRLYDAQQNMP